MMEIKNLKKIYTSKDGRNSVAALKNINFSIDEGEFIAVMGESGSGKTTLLNILAAIDKPTGGSVILNNKDLSSIKDKDLAKFRRENLGFVFQEFNLLDTLTIEENIFLPLVLDGKNYELMQSRLKPIAGQLHIEHLLKKYPFEISGGEKQRVAVARAMIVNPQLILADEPTGALDSKSSDDLLKLFDNINQTGQTILMVTHSVKAASTAQRVLFIKDGVVFHQIYKGNNSNEEFYKRIANTLTILSNQGVSDENKTLF